MTQEEFDALRCRRGWQQEEYINMSAASMQMQIAGWTAHLMSNSHSVLARDAMAFWSYLLNQKEQQT